jgi:hypothetical protein
LDSENIHAQQTNKIVYKPFDIHNLSACDIVYRVNPFSIHDNPDLYRKLPFSIHVGTDLYRKQYFSIHDGTDLYRKQSFPVHVNPDIFRDFHIKLSCGKVRIDCLKLPWSQDQPWEVKV